MKVKIKVSIHMREKREGVIYKERERDIVELSAVACRMGKTIDAIHLKSPVP